MFARPAAVLPLLPHSPAPPAPPPPPFCPRPDLFLRNHPWRLRRDTRPSHRLFHASARRDDGSTFYDVLELPTTASPGEIKKQFYKLSKAHHPDLHPSDPTAAQRFVRISEAHATLGSPEKKAKYDRDVLRTTSPSSSSSTSGGASPYPGGSFSSSASGPGGRPASGLSRRRTQFRGPPPSFYRSGGWGAHGEKRSEHASRASQSREARGEAASGPGGPDSGGPFGGTGPGGFTAGFDNDVGHFDQRGHAERQRGVERTRHQGRRRSGRGVTEAETVETSGGNPTVGNFVVVSGVLGLIYAVTFGVFGWGEREGKRRQREKEGEKGREKEKEKDGEGS